MRSTAVLPRNSLAVPAENVPSMLTLPSTTTLSQEAPLKTTWIVPGPPAPGLTDASGLGDVLALTAGDWLAEPAASGEADGLTDASATALEGRALGEADPSGDAEATPAML